MPGMGTLINVIGILAGGMLGMWFGKRFSSRMQETLNRACGISVLFIGMAGALEEMMKNDGRSMFIVICIVLGGLIGELIDIEGWFERIGKWLKIKSGNAKDPMFVEGFVTASLTVCIGAMAVVGAIEDGIHGDFSILATKAVLDLVLVMIMSGYMGIGCVFSALPVAVFEGLMTIFAMLMKSVMITSALSDLSLIGSILIFCVGVNLVWDKRVRVANLLPSLILAVIFAFVPVI